MEKGEKRIGFRRESGERGKGCSISADGVIQDPGVGRFANEESRPDGAIRDESCVAVGIRQIASAAMGVCAEIASVGLVPLVELEDHRLSGGNGRNGGGGRLSQSAVAEDRKRGGTLDLIGPAAGKNSRRNGKRRHQPVRPVLAE